MNAIEIYILSTKQREDYLKGSGGEYTMKNKVKQTRMTSWKAEHQAMPVCYDIKQTKKAFADRNPINKIN